MTTTPPRDPDPMTGPGPVPRVEPDTIVEADADESSQQGPEDSGADSAVPPVDEGGVEPDDLPTGVVPGVDRESAPSIVSVVPAPEPPADAAVEGPADDDGSVSAEDPQDPANTGPATVPMPSRSRPTTPTAPVRDETTVRVALPLRPSTALTQTPAAVPEPATERRRDADVESDAESDVEPQPPLTSEPVSDPEPEPGPESVPDPEPGPVPDPEPGPVPDPEPGPVPDPEPAPEPDPEPGPVPEPAVGARSGPEPDSDVGAGRADLAAGSPAGEDPADAARRRFWRAVRPRASRSQLVVALICALLGFGAAVQVRQAQDQSLSSLRQSDLLIVLDNVTQESARLDDEAAQLQQTLEELRNDPAGSPAAREAAQDRLNVLGILAGTVPATGPGITMTVTDPQHAVDATDLLETVQELRDAGAEAMQIGPARIVASTSFVDSPQGVLIDGTLVTPSYEFTVIGDTQTLAAALKIPGGVVEALRSKNAETVITSATEVRVTALRPVTNGQYARPAQPGS